MQTISHWNASDGVLLVSRSKSSATIYTLSYSLLVAEVLAVTSDGIIHMQKICFDLISVSTSCLSVMY